LIDQLHQLGYHVTVHPAQAAGRRGRWPRRRQWSDLGVRWGPNGDNPHVIANIGTARASRQQRYRRGEQRRVPDPCWRRITGL
jgi:hypothetical protein